MTSNRLLVEDNNEWIETTFTGLSKHVTLLKKGVQVNGQGNFGLSS